MKANKRRNLGSLLMHAYHLGAPPPNILVKMLKFSEQKIGNVLTYAIFFIGNHALQA